MVHFVKVTFKQEDDRSMDFFSLYRANHYASNLVKEVYVNKTIVANIIKGVYTTKHYGKLKALIITGETHQRVFL